MEVEANLLFDTYRELYFDGGHSSVYFWDLEGSGFAACFLIKKVTEGGDTVKMGSWDGIHVIEVTEKAGSSPKQFVYKLTSTVMLNTNIENSESGKTTLAGSVTRQAEKTTGIEGENSHVANMGSMVEDMETDMRQHLLAITYVQKMGDILRETRNVSENASDEDKSALNKIAESMNAAALGAKVAGIAKEA
jgi:capping protein beta